MFLLSFESCYCSSMVLVSFSLPLLLFTNSLKCFLTRSPWLQKQEQTWLYSALYEKKKKTWKMSNLSVATGCNNEVLKDRL